jgi:hypothetical protein
MRVSAIPAFVLAAALALPAEDFARIYVYARRETAARSWLAVSCGGAVVAELKRGFFFAIRVSPGPYSAGVENGVPLSVEVSKGEEAFVRLDWNYSVGRAAIPVLSKVRPAEAEREMMSLSYIRSGRIHSGNVWKADPRAPRERRLKTRRE